MLSAAQLQAWCRRLHLAPATCAFLTQVRSSPPVRRVQARGANVSGTYASRKMGCTIQFESHTVELWAIYTMEHDPTVLEYYDQPTTVRLRYPSRAGRRVTVSHTPDFLVLTHEGAWLDEWKTEEKLQQLTQAQPHRYVRDEHGHWRCPPGEEAAASLGLRYRVRSSVELAPEVIQNLIFLDDYCSGPRLPLALTTHVQDLVRATPGISLATLVQTQPQLTLDVVYALIAGSHLYVDLAACPLIAHDAVRLYPDRATADAHALLADSSRHAEDVQGWEPLAQPIGLAADTPLLWDGQRWQLLNLGHTTVTLRAAEGHLTELPRPFFQDLLAAGKVTVPHVPDALGLAHLHPEAQRLLREASPRALETANARYTLVHAYQQRQHPASAGTPVPVRTLRLWVARFKAAEAMYGTGYIGLLPQTARCGNRTRTAGGAALELLETFLTDVFERPTQPHARAVYRAYHHACAERGIPALSERTFYRRLHRRRGPEQTSRRQGTRAAYQEQPWYWELTRTTPRHGDRPWEIVHIDHTKLDIELCTALGRVLGRPWATFAVDAYSRRVLACALAFDPPSYRACMMVLRVCVRRHQRLPQIVVIDGGAEFRSTYFEGLLAHYYCTKKTRPSAQPRFGAVIERLFGTTNTAFIHNLLGNTQATTHPRLVTKAVDPSRQAVWPLADLYQYLCEWAYEVYDQTTHEALGTSPREAYATGLARGGERAHRRIPYDDAFIMATHPSPRKSTAKVIPGRGVKVHYLFYWHEALRHPDVEGTQVPVRYDPFNVGMVYAYVRGQWVRCLSQYYATFQGHSEKELAMTTELLRQQARMQRQAAVITPRRLADFLVRVQAHERVLVQRLHDQEARGVLACISAGGEARAPDTHAATAPASESWEPVDLARLPVYEEYR
jgi:putative transposase